MRKLSTALLIACVMLLAACGGSGNSNNATGNWAGTLTATQGSSMSMTVSLTMNADNTLAGSNLVIKGDSNGCLRSPSGPTGSLAKMPDPNGKVVNVVTLIVQGTDSMGNSSLNLRGAMTGGSISGAWSVSGLDSKCFETGTFTLNEIQPPYSPKGS